MNYLNQVYSEPVPQNEPLRDRPEMVENSAGGYVFPVDDFTRMRRFLILGSEGGSYYATERKLTIDNADAVVRCIQSDPKRVLEEIMRASNGAAPRNDTSLFCLALAESKGEVATKQRAFEMLPQVARTGSHLLQFVQFVTGIRR